MAQHGDSSPGMGDARAGQGVGPPGQGRQRPDGEQRQSTVSCGRRLLSSSAAPVPFSLRSDAARAAQRPLDALPPSAAHTYRRARLCSPRRPPFTDCVRRVSRALTSMLPLSASCTLPLRAGAARRRCTRALSPTTRRRWWSCGAWGHWTRSAICGLARSTSTRCVTFFFLLSSFFFLLSSSSSSSSAASFRCREAPAVCRLLLPLFRSFIAGARVPWAGTGREAAGVARPANSCSGGAFPCAALGAVHARLRAPRPACQRSTCRPSRRRYTAGAGCALFRPLCRASCVSAIGLARAAIYTLAALVPTDSSASSTTAFAWASADQCRGATGSPAATCSRHGS